MNENSEVFDGFFSSDHPQKETMQAIRNAMLGADVRIKYLVRKEYLAVKSRGV